MPDLFPFGECSSLCVGSVQAKQAVSISGAPGASFQGASFQGGRRSRGAAADTAAPDTPHRVKLADIEGGRV